MDGDTPKSPKRVSSDKDAYRLLQELTNSQDWASLNIQTKDDKAKETSALAKHSDEWMKETEKPKSTFPRSLAKWNTKREEVSVRGEKFLPIPMPSLAGDENDDSDDSNSRQYLLMNLLSNKIETPICKTSPTAAPDISINSRNQNVDGSVKKTNSVSFKSEPSSVSTVKITNGVNIEAELSPLVESAQLVSAKSESLSVSSIKSEHVETKMTKEIPEIKGCGVFEVISNKVFNVNGRSYYALSILGQGGSGKVYQVMEVESSKLLALKEVNLENDAASFQNEIEILSKLRDSDRVIKMHDFEVKEKSLLIVLEKGDCDLSSILREARKGTPLTRVQVKYFWSELLLAVAEIHKAGIIHLDLKPANFVQVMGKLKLIDFGIAGAIPEDMTSVVKDTTIGTINYMSPEQLSGTRQTGQFRLRTKSDVWSLGCILYHLLFGVTPFHHIAQLYPKLRAITNPNYQIRFPKIEDPSVLDVLTACLQHDPKNRPTIEELQAHRYLTGSRVPVSKVLA